ISDSPVRPEFQSPLFHWSPSIAPAGLTFYTGNQFPKWKGNILIGELVFEKTRGTGRQLQRIVISSAGNAMAREALLGQLQERIRDVKQDPTGCVYVLTEEANAALLRIEPVPGHR